MALPARARDLLLSKRASSEAARSLRPGLSQVRGDTPILSNPSIDKAIDCDTGHHDRLTVLNARKLPAHGNTIAFLNQV